MSANASEQTEREAFEAVARHLGLSLEKNGIDGDYISNETWGAFHVWQECHASELRSLRDSLALARSHIVELREALRSFVYEFGDKTNSATVNKARAALKEKGE